MVIEEELFTTANIQCIIKASLNSKYKKPVIHIWETEWGSTSSTWVTLWKPPTFMNIYPGTLLFTRTSAGCTPPPLVTKPEICIFIFISLHQPRFESLTHSKVSWTALSLWNTFAFQIIFPSSSFCLCQHVKQERILNELMDFFGQKCK